MPTAIIATTLSSTAVASSGLRACRDANDSGPCIRPLESVGFDSSDGLPEEFPKDLLKLGITREMCLVLAHALAVVVRRPVTVCVFRGEGELPSSLARTVFYRTPDASRGLSAAFVKRPSRVDLLQDLSLAGELAAAAGLDKLRDR